MKKIIYIIDGLKLGGAERMVFELATKIDKKEFNSEVIFLTGSKDDYFAVKLAQASIPVKLFLKKSKLNLGLFLRLRHYLAEAKPDIVHTHLFTSDICGSFSARSAGVKVIISTEHNINVNLNFIYHFLKRRANKNIQTIVAVSQAVANYIKVYDKTASTKIKVIYNGVDLTKFSSKRNHSGLSTNKPTMAVVGRLEPQKGHLNLLRALQFVKVPYQLNIFGSGSLKPKILKAIALYNLKDKVKLQGVAENVTQVYQTSDIVLVPSVFEGFGLSAIEAMASGCVVIAANVDGLKEIIEHQKNGLLVNILNPEETARTITTILENANYRQQLSCAAVKRAQQFDIHKTVFAYQKLYSSSIISKI
ncbi:MAG: hypothetical protein A2233_00995 [Candidatus Kerfeldbacteria bacterium RIFOXYA2_FULL_38_24]|uniref:Glycosyltransferase subfamily 4-like N-terminal domain-containing protein n=1 Tax=Candidatus Kerfeldbacteria bacterium RIFOXYB2_FULL_38_14 TaxID=1798547 RepID=A0A1G2BBC2_9BACT|nr:MAG: hypothetical protein A2233_00995 [Candidatus Kerfeldbacteria bacterium RIFOXYA2_FULL_38_24]OGY86513.1 MAG: hypothetical protein A2319_01985 [Candidatus Kerfeldbacteria bacterium RIFOXYB2_FULL_38_14]OGY90296.1 MAG: hypothetical protein A2458_02230 [Candidatus Kerfeldbacteria bacterium RIFOXYC2_FULL_38_9]